MFRCLGRATLNARMFLFCRLVFKTTQVALLFSDFLVVIVQQSFALPSQLIVQHIVRCNTNCMSVLHKGCVFTGPNNQLNILSRCLFKEQHLLVKRDICFHWKFNPEDSNYENAQLSKMTEGESAFPPRFMERRRHLFRRMSLISPEIRKMRRNAVSNARTRLTRRRRVIERILAEELENRTGPLKW